MNFAITNQSLRGLAAAIGAGVLTLGLSSAVFAHETDDGYRDAGHRSAGARTVYYSQGQHNYRGGRHGRRGYAHGSPRQVIVLHRYDPPVEVVEVYEQPTRVVTRIEEQRTAGYPYSGNNNQINAGSLIGAALGGLVGAQVGGGNGKLAATAAGTVGGFLLGNHATQRAR